MKLIIICFPDGNLRIQYGKIYLRKSLFGLIYNIIDPRINETDSPIDQSWTSHDSEWREDMIYKILRIINPCQPAVHLIDNLSNARVFHEHHGFPQCLMLSPQLFNFYIVNMTEQQKSALPTLRLSPRGVTQFNFLKKS